MSRLVMRDERRERRTMLNVVRFLARFLWAFAIGYMLGLLAPR